MIVVAGIPTASRAADAPARYGSKTADEWRSDLDFRFDPRVRERAAEALGWMGADAAVAVPALVGALGDETSGVRREAAIALGRIGPAASGAVPALAKAIDDRFEDVGLAAIRSLRALGPVAGEAVAALLGALDEERLAAPAIEALGRIGPGARRAVPALERLSRGTDDTLAARAREALVLIRTE